MMVPIKNEREILNSELNFSTNYWLYFSFEFLIGIVISGFVAILGMIKSLLPKPPRDLAGDVVLIVGASSPLGESLAEEFAGNGCSVICVDNLRSVEKITAGLRSRHHRVEEIGPEYRKHEPENGGSTLVAYECDLLDRDAIREIAEKIKDEVGGIDVLVTCIGETDDIFNVASMILMNHCWTILSFLPLLRRDNAHVVEVMPVDNIYLSSRTATGLMECLCQELSNHSGRLTYLGMTRKAEHHGSIRQTEQELALEIVQAVRGNYGAISTKWWSKILYRVSFVIYNAITTVTQWLYQDCDY